MARKKSSARSRRAWALAGRQHGLLSRRNLLELGFSRSAIEHRLDVGRLHAVARGVYAVGWPALTRERRWMAAILACGDGAVLSHRSAAELWGIANQAPGRIDVSVRRGEHRRAGVRVRSRRTLAAEDITALNHIPVTCPARTLVDLAGELGPRALERAVNEADKRGAIDPETLRGELERYVGQPGVRKLRALLDRHTFALSDSELESRFLRLVASAGLPRPVTQRRVNGFRVDFYWPEEGLVLETDGLRYHRTPAEQARDRLRDQAHTAAGLATLRFTHHQVTREPAHVRKVLKATLAQLSAHRASADG